MIPQEQEAFARVEKAIKNIEQAYDAGFKAGRLQGLREMHEACDSWELYHSENETLERLIKEYQQPN